MEAWKYGGMVPGLGGEWERLERMYVWSLACINKAGRALVTRGAWWGRVVLHSEVVMRARARPLAE